MNCMYIWQKIIPIVKNKKNWWISFLICLSRLNTFYARPLSIISSKFCECSFNCFYLKKTMIIARPLRTIDKKKKFLRLKFKWQLLLKGTASIWSMNIKFLFCPSCIVFLFKVVYNRTPNWNFKWERILRGK